MFSRLTGLLLVLTTATAIACSPSTSTVPGSVSPSTEPDDSTPGGSTGTPTSSPPATELTPVLGVVWAPCDDPLATDPTLQCATLDVQLDYDQPDGDTISIALVRVPARSDAARQGAVLFNPGGPGGSGFDYVAQGGTTIVAEMGLGDFDLVGFDPRGVDRSGGIRCLTDQQQDESVYLDSSPDTPDEQAALDEADALFEMACLDRYGDDLRHFSTENTARDMDEIRRALGDDQISFLGISYGTYLGATYATMFPDQVRAMVLDSAFEPTGDTLEQAYTTQLVGFEEAFGSWATWCENEPSCAFRSPDVKGAWDRLRRDLDATPVVAGDGRLGNQTVMEVATISALYSDTQWPVLAKGLAAIRSGDPSTLFRLADSYVGRDDDGTFSTIEQSGGVIRCASGLSAALPDDPDALVARLRELAPRFAADVTADDFTDDCAALMPSVTTPALTYEGDAPILVVGGTNDPATPFRWAEEMTDAMGDSARLLTFTGEGHGFVLASSCVTEAEAAVLVELELPDDDATCDPDPIVERPDWWDALPVPDGVSNPIESEEIAALLGLAPTLAYSEIRTSTIDPLDVLDAYDAALEQTGFSVAGRQQPIDGIDQAVYFSPEGDLLSVLVIGPDSFDLPELDDLDQVADPTATLVVVLHIPQ